MNATILERTTVLVIAAAAAACASRSTDLTPVDVDRTTPAGGEVAVHETAGVRIEVATGAWRGSMLVPKRTTPLDVTFENGSSHRMAVRYEEFALIGADGRRYAALTPFQADPGPRSVAPLRDLRLTYEGFYPAPHLSAYYPFLQPFRSPVFYDPMYWDHYYLGGWDGFGPAVSEVRLWAVPEGVLDTGGEIRGYLFFEHVEAPPEGPAKVTLRMDLVDADSGERFGTAEIDLNVSATGG